MKLKRAQIENFRSASRTPRDSRSTRRSRVSLGRTSPGRRLLTALYRLSPIFETDPKFDHQKDYPRRFLSDYAERHGGEPRSL